MGKYRLPVGIFLWPHGFFISYIKGCSWTRSEWDGEGEPEREAGSPMSKEPDAGLHPGPEMQADALLTEPPRHPSV